MTNALKVLDRVALALTGGGLLGGAMAFIDVLPAPGGLVCAIAVGVGLVACVVVRLFAPDVPEHVKAWFDDEPRLKFPHDSLRIKDPISDPMDSSVPGTYAWSVQNDTIAKPY